MNPKLNYFSLLCILGGAFGFPTMMIGRELSKIYGSGTALISIFIGNFILWILGFAILAMTKEGFNALENIRYYLGKKIAPLIALIWFFAFTMWFSVGLKTTSDAISWNSMWMIGVIVSILSMKGLKIIKQISLILFPCLLFFALYFLGANYSTIQFTGGWDFSYVGILSVVFAWIPLTLNLPTIFRFSQSKEDSLIGLTLFTLSHVFFQVFAIFTLPIESEILISIYLIANVMANFLNIYFAKSGWEMISKKINEGLKSLIIGFAGTALYFFQIFSQFVEEVLVNFLVILGVVLLFDFFIRAFVQHRPRSLEKFWSSFCWIAGCFISILIKFKGQLGPEKTTMIGVIACSLIFLILIFIEESIWSTKKLLQREHVE